MTPTLASIQPLLEQFKDHGLMVSCYVDLPGTAEFAARWPGPFKAKLGAIKEIMGSDARAWRQFERNFQAISGVVESADIRHARGLAVFAALQRGFFQSHTLEVPVENDLVVSESPYLARE